MGLYEIDPQKVTNLLTFNYQADESKSRILKDLFKEWKRLKIDIQIASERRFIDFKEVVLNKLIEFESEEKTQEILNELQKSNPIELLSNVITAQNCVINIYEANNIQNLNTKQKIIKGGKPSISQKDLNLLKYFTEYLDERESNQYMNYLEEIKDKNMSKEGRKSLKTKISSFLYKYAKEIPDNEINETINYLKELTR